MRCLMTAFVMLWAWAALAQEDGQYAPHSALGLRLKNASYVVDFDERGALAGVAKRRPPTFLAIAICTDEHGPKHKGHPRVTFVF